MDRSPSVLAPYISVDPRNFSELVTACGRIVRAWGDAGGENLDDIVIGFYGIETQADDVELSVLERPDAEADFFRFFYPQFTAERERVQSLINSAVESGR